MKVKELLPFKTNKKSFKKTIKSVSEGNIFCLESFSSYLERHEKKGELDRKKTLRVFLDYPLLNAYEFIREFLRNYLLENGSIFVNNFKTLSLTNKEIKTNIYNSYSNNKYYPTYYNSITGRLYSNYQSWAKINQKHTLHYLSKEKLTSIDVKACILTVYLNVITLLEEDVEDIKNMIYNTEQDPYIYFFVKILVPSVLEDSKSYKEDNIYRYFLTRKEVLEALIEISELEVKPISKEYVLKVLKTIGKKILISYIFQGTTSTFNAMVKLLGIKKNILDYRIINSPFKIGKWNRFLYNIGKQTSKGLILEKIHNFYIPPLTEYFSKESRLSAYILENLGNYSIFGAMVKLILRDIPIRAYFFDEILIPDTYLEYKEDIISCFLKNNIMPLAVRIKN